MLVKLDLSGAPLGIAVTQWHIKTEESQSELRTFVLIPAIRGDRLYADVDVLTIEADEIEVVMPKTEAWQKLGEYGYGDDPEGYPIDKTTHENLYYVWDDGASEHAERAEALYAYYEPLINHYYNCANEYLLKMFEAQRAEAKAKGWDTNSFSDHKMAFPYRPKHSPRESKP
jgi:hypothetical protein